MSLILNSLATTLQPFIKRPVWVAFSGGIDSQVLLHALANLKSSKFPDLNLNVCHVHHGLSDNADTWLAFAEHTCNQLKLPLVTHRVKLTVNARESLEAVAREARYQVFKTVCHKNAVIVTGHHQDDQWETFLLALKRGSGVQGLGAMQQLSNLGHQQQVLCRPLLNTSKRAIYDYAKLHALDWIEDESNQDTRFDRNFIRHHLTPMLTERWTAFISTVARSAQHCQEAQQILNEVAEQDLQLTLSNEGRISVEPLLALSFARQKQVIRQLLQNNDAKMPSQVQIEQALLQIQQPELSTLKVKLGDHWLRHFQSQLYLTKEYEDITSWSANVILPKAGQVSLDLPDDLGKLVISTTPDANGDKTLVFAVTNKDEQLSVQFTHNNPKILPDYRQHHRSLKKVWQELAIPTWQRNRIPLLFSQNELVAAAGQFVCQPFKQADCRQTYYLNWLA
ncbi:tRNA lysidine(34) synthetase TilS [Thalassotalea marina]|uniref:tRNA(Ile)-lysidine synthase n=1 Tax=Thalassotalea marina TaxID=1673741 RepID=A0A919BPK8_9GAMM|nr:tRNA lysidine(34) synthetase TilS [Thalassotalea marina]GHG01062.1 tRNA(Ile)-lysidine synthase [Thalassotalea marina]